MIAAAVRGLGLALAASVLAACGFTLRGGGDLPPALQAVYVQPGAAAASTLDELRQLIEAGGGRVLSSPQGANAVLHITADQLRRRVLTVKGSGKVNEYRFEQTLRFRLTDPQGREWVAEQDVQLERDFLFDPLAVIGSSREEGAVAERLRRDAVQVMLRKLRTQLR